LPNFKRSFINLFSFKTKSHFVFTFGLKQNANSKEVFKLNKPIQKWRIANLEAVVWENKRKVNNAEVSFKTVSITRSFRKKDENIWRSEVINNLRRNDIPKLIALLQKVQEYLYFESSKEEEEVEEE